MAAVRGLIAVAKTFRSNICLQRYIREVMELEMRNRFEALSRENGGKSPALDKKLKLIELSKLAAAQYKELSDAEKQELRHEYEERKAVYEKEMSDFLAGCSDSEIKEMQEAAKLQKQKRKRRREKKESKEFSKPKKPLTGFFLFMQECRERDSKENPEKFKAKKITEYTEEISAEWRKLTPSEKATYEKMYQKAKVDYDKKLLAWEALMIKENKFHLVRTSHLPLPKPKKKKKKAMRSGMKDTAPKGDPKDHDLSDSEE